MAKVEGLQRHTYRGGSRWRGINATWPFIEVSISDAGIKVGPATWWTLGVPRLDLAWSDVEAVGAVRGVLPMGYGVAFKTGGKRLIFWCLTPDRAAEVIELAREYVPEKVGPPGERKIVL